MVEIGGRPILWHIMKIYAAHGINDFIICPVTRGYLIKEYDTMTGGRLKRITDHVRGEDAFCFTYGDGLSNVDVGAAIRFHRERGTLATVTAVRPPGRFGALDVENHRITGFREKPDGDGGWINGGFFVLSPGVMDYIAGDLMTWEREPLEALARDGQLSAYTHTGFWQPMDTLRDKVHLEELWQSGAAPWKCW
ncbi:MAG: glucose-1-phosphate cytidylyltransferase [Gammaproteobacteria bacterium]|nr:glucose-1-phosphate cytidylyltransferase [Gammaproteobacteria bacterium]